MNVTRRYVMVWTRERKRKSVRVNESVALMTTSRTSRRTTSSSISCEKWTRKIKFNKKNSRLMCELIRGWEKWKPMENINIISQPILHTSIIMTIICCSFSNFFLSSSIPLQLTESLRAIIKEFPISIVLGRTTTRLTRLGAKWIVRSSGKVSIHKKNELASSTNCQK